MSSNSDGVSPPSGIAIHFGGCDKSGHALLIFPSSSTDSSAEISVQDIIVSLNYTSLLVTAELRQKGLSFLINLQKTNQQIIHNILSAFNAFQLANSNGIVNSLYVMKPKTSKNVSLLEKLTGVKSSKKNLVNSSYEVVICKDLAALHRNVDKSSLTEEYGGHQHIDVQGWVQFRLKIDKLTSDINRSLLQSHEAKDQMQILCDLEIPADDKDSRELLDKINNKYNDVMRDLNLEHLVDQCCLIMEELVSTKVPFQYAQGGMLKELIAFLRNCQKELTESREHMQIQWRRAQARVIQACQLKGHQKKAVKICKWIARKGRTTLDNLNKSIPTGMQDQAQNVPQSISEIEKTIKELQAESDYIQTDVEYMAIEDHNEFSDYFQSIEKMKADLSDFASSVSELKKKYNITSSVYTSVAKCYNWYSELMKNLSLSGDGHQMVNDYRNCLLSLSESSPPLQWLNFIQENVQHISDGVFVEATQVLLSRTRNILSLNDGKQPPDLKDLIVWKETADDGFISLAQKPTSSVVRHRSPFSLAPSHHSARVSAITPKLKKSPVCDLSSSTDAEVATQPVARKKRPMKSRSTPKLNMINQKGLGEVYVDLCNVADKVKLPPSLSHIDLKKFLENEPSEEKADDCSDKSAELEVLPGHNLLEKQIRAHPNLKKSRRGTKYKEDVDDTCPYPSIRSVSSTVGKCIEDTRVTEAPEQNPIIHPTDTKARLEEIYSSKEITAEQKLDMMASLIEEIDDSAFIATNSHDKSFTQVRRRESDPSANAGGLNSSQLTSENLNRELSADVCSSEHVYSWLSKQNEHIHSRREQITNSEEIDSVRACIARAEKILAEEMPGMSVYAENQSRNSNGGYIFSADRKSRSGDSGITDGTTLSLSHGRRPMVSCVSKDSGLDSDVTAADHYFDKRKGPRPMDVPALWPKRAPLFKHHCNSSINESD